MRAILIACLATITLGAGQAYAQTRFDVGLLLGTTMTSDEAPALAFDRGTTYQATFAWCVWRSEAVAMSLETPFIASPAFTVTTPGGGLPKEYASLYLTPGIRLTVAPTRLVSVFGSVGAGGVDVRALRWLGFRGELRDVYTGARNFSVVTPRRAVHNLVVSGGFVLRL